MTNLSIQVCAVQMNSQQNIEENLIQAEGAIATASQQDSQLIVLPENVCSMGRQRQTAERYDELSQHFGELASKYQVYLLAGTLPCPYRPDGNKVPNDKVRQTSLLFAPDGNQIARYDKIHLFKALVNDSHGNYDEGLTFEAGTELVVAPIQFEQNCPTIKLGMMVCFDLRFPKMAQTLRQMGANIITAPSAFTYRTGEANWSLLLQARALDSQCMVIGAGQGGEHHYQNGQIRQTWGHAGITSSCGKILQQYDNHLLDNNADQRFQLINATFNTTVQQQQRDSLPIFHCHRLA